MFFDAELPKVYWAEVISTVVYLLKRSPIQPKELSSGATPTIGHLRVFVVKKPKKTFLQMQGQKKQQKSRYNFHTQNEQKSRQSAIQYDRTRVRSTAFEQNKKEQKNRNVDSGELTDHYDVEEALNLSKSEDCEKAMKKRHDSLYFDGG